jgi:hypothetical protein
MKGIHAEDSCSPEPGRNRAVQVLARYAKSALPAPEGSYSGTPFWSWKRPEVLPQSSNKLTLARINRPLVRIN